MNRSGITILSAVITGIISSVFAQKVVTTRHKLIPAYQVDKITIVTSDTLLNTDNLLYICGYEKALRSSRETIFIHNPTDSVIDHISLTIQYLDTSGRMIHKRSLSHDVDIPPKETRRYDIPSWDTQKSYYYIQGDRPRKTATPYDVSIATDTIILHKP